MRRLLAVTLSILIFTEPVLSNAAQANFWLDRKSAPAVTSLSTKLKSSLPALTASPETSFPDIDPNLGRVSRVTGSGQLRSPVFLIQDVHGSLEAQTNIRKAVSLLLSGSAPPTLALEGAFGPVDLLRYRRFKEPQVLAAATDYLFSGLAISGPARAALGATGGNVLGIDDAALHAENVSAFLDARSGIVDTKNDIGKIQSELESEKAAVLNPALAELDRTVSEFRAGRASLVDYIERLSRESSTEDVDHFLDAARLERSIDFERAESDRARLLERLTLKASNQELSALIADATALRLGRLSPAAFYRRFENLCQINGISLATSPDLASYIQYVSLIDAIDGGRLWDALPDLEREAYRRETRTAEEASLVGRSRAALAAGRLVDFSLTPAEWREWRDNLRNDVPSDLNRFEAFYRAAEARDERMAENVASIDGPVVLVVGGFHTDGLTRRLSGAGHKVIVWTPSVKVSEAGDTTKALGVFAREKTPLEELFQGEKLFLASYPFQGLADLPPLVAALSSDPERSVSSLWPGTSVTVRRGNAASTVEIRRGDKAAATTVRHRGGTILGTSRAKISVWSWTGSIYERLSKRSRIQAAFFAASIGGMQEFVARIIFGGALVLTVDGASLWPIIAVVYAFYFATIDHPAGRFLGEQSTRQLSPSHRAYLFTVALVLGGFQIALLTAGPLGFESALSSAAILGVTHGVISLIGSWFGLPFAMAGQKLQDQLPAILAERDRLLPKIRAMDAQQFSDAVRTFRRAARIGEFTAEKVGQAVALFSAAAEAAIASSETDPEIAGYVGGAPTNRQIEAALALLGDRNLAGMRPSEGKTLTVALASFLKVSLGERVEVHNWNSTLTSRDAQVAGVILSRLGIKVGALVGQKIAVVDPKKSNLRAVHHLDVQFNSGAVTARR